MTVVEIVVAVVAVVAAGLAMNFWLRGRKLRADAERRFTQAENSMLAADGLERQAVQAQAAALGELAAASARCAEAQRIEELLVHPRFALQKETGAIRALKASENPDPLTEILASAPDPNCRKCFGRGWIARRKETGQVIPCPCIKLAR